MIYRGVAIGGLPKGRLMVRAAGLLTRLRRPLALMRMFMVRLFGRECQIGWPRIAHGGRLIEIAVAGAYRFLVKARWVGVVAARLVDLAKNAVVVPAQIIPKKMELAGA